MTTATSVFRSGDVVASRFRIVRYLAQGGMGELYEAEDLELRERIALKTILAHIAANDRSIALFKREVHLARQVTHPNVCRIYDIFRHQATPGRAQSNGDDVVLLAMELLHGETLAEKLRRDGRFATSDALPIARQMADGLTAAHRVGVVHRDFKSHNVMLEKPAGAGKGMRVVITDFGLARRQTQSDRTSLSLSQSEENTVSGTPAYMAPEQVEGGPVTPAADVYALGVVLYEMVTGVWPFTGDTAISIMIKRLREPPPSPRVHVPALDAAWEVAILRCLERRPEDRFASASEVADALVGASTRLAPSSLAVDSNANTVAPLVRRSSRDAERRQLTVVVAGCHAFESDAYQALDAEDQARMLRTFQEPCEEWIHKFGGSIVQRTDTGVIACFGFPVAYEDAAGRAARSGLAIVDAFKSSEEPKGHPGLPALQPWVVVHTGTGVVEATGGDCVSLIGEARNVAVRLEDVAVAGQVICTDASHRLFQGQLHSAALGLQKVKNITHPVELFRVEHVVVGGSPVDAASAAELSPLTGRDQEIGLLMDRWEQAREGIGQVVLLLGEPGVGKSRLVHAMKEHVLGQVVEGELDAPVIEWRCSPHFQNTRLYPAIDFFERALAIDGEEPRHARFERLLHRLEQYGLARPDTVPLWASLLSLPTPDQFPRLSLSPARQREETFQAMLEWLQTRIARKPVLFVVEDLHWADASTLEFLGQLLTEGLDDSILALFTFRSDFKPPWPAVAHQTSLALNRLTRRQVGELMRNQTRAALSEVVVDQIYDRTGGVPLFVEEFTKMVQKSGALQQAPALVNSTWLKRQIPATLQDLVMARLDRMGGEREIAQLAATLGREFSYELLSAVADRDEPTLQRDLEELVRAEIVYAKGRPPHSSYTFKHALLEDALYNALVKEKRQQFHRRIGEVLKAQFPQTAETRPELLAHHFTEAGLAAEAMDYWLKAGLRSAERSAHHEAIGHLTAAATSLDTLEDTGTRDEMELRVLSLLAPEYIAVRGYAAPEAGPVLNRARELCERVGQPSHLFGILLGTWEWRLVRGDIRMCIDLAADGMALAERVNDPGMLMEALFMQGVTMFYRGEYAAARASFEKAITSYDDRERTKAWAAHTGHNAGVTHRCYLALTLWQLGYADQARTVDRETRDLADRIGHAFTTAHAIDFTACLHQFCRVGAEVQRAAEQEIAIAAEQGFQLWHALGTLHKGAALSLEGRLDDAIPVLLEGLQSFRATGAGLRIPYYLGILGNAYTRAGRFEDAHRVLDEALATAEKNDDRFQEAELHRLAGELVLSESPEDAAAAEVCFTRAINLACRRKGKAWELRATMSLARLWQRQGHGEQARSALAAAYGSYTEGFTTPDLVDAKTLLETLAG